MVGYTRAMGAEVLTWEEIKQRYPDEWVLIANPEVDADDEVVAGVVAFHSQDREEVGREAYRLRLRSAAFLYSGELWDPDVAYVL